MYRRYYGGYEDCSSPQVLPLPSVPCPCEGECDPPVRSLSSKSSFPFDADDILLFCVFLFLLHEECEDKLMLTVIGLLLVSGFVG